MVLRKGPRKGSPWRGLDHQKKCNYSVKMARSVGQESAVDDIIAFGEDRIGLGHATSKPRPDRAGAGIMGYDSQFCENYSKLLCDFSW